MAEDGCHDSGGRREALCVRPAGLRIFALGVEDAGRLAALFAACMERPWSEHAFASGLRAPGACALAVVDGHGAAPVAAALFRQLGPEAELLLIGVHPQYRRQGLARALLQAGCALLKASGVAHVHLEVDERNHPARVLYRAFGFCETGRRPAYYPATASHPARDAVLMRLDLSATEA